MKLWKERIAVSVFFTFCVVLSITMVCWGFNVDSYAFACKAIGFCGCIGFPVCWRNAWNDLSEEEER